MRWRVGLGVGVVVGFAACGGWATAARAEVFPTAQAVAADAAWLAYAPPPPTPVSVCLVDTGVDLNADTSEAVITRDALDHGAVDDMDTTMKHGTRMAMMMAAPANGVGMVGIWPALRIVSVRVAGAVASGPEVAFPFADYAKAIDRCMDGPVATTVIELALANAGDVSTTGVVHVADEVLRAHAAGLNVVAAAGNDGGPVGIPANVPGIFAAGASDDAGALCRFSSRGSELAISAPGCHLETADPVTLASETGTEGTSQASALVAVVLAALRSYNPELSPLDAENVLRRTARDGALDAAAAFRAIGRADIVDRGMSSMPATPLGKPLPESVGSSVHHVDSPSPNARPARPHVTAVRYRGRVLTVRVGKRPPGLSLRVIIQRWARRQYVTIRTIDREASIVRTRCTRPVRVQVEYVTARGLVSPKWVVYLAGR